jgi:putative phosphoribosyl transferase
MREVTIAAHEVRLPGLWTAPQGARAIIVFAHGSGSSRLSIRNQFVAGQLQEAGFATLLPDLLTMSEEDYDRRTDSLRFDIPFLAGRLMSAIQWCREQDAETHLPMGLFGASTGAAAALVAAVASPVVSAIVSRGGRVDMAGSALPSVRAPTLLIVGSNDLVVLDLNRKAAQQLGCTHEIAVVAGASHLFEERGALEQVSELARDWFTRYLAGS